MRLLLRAWREIYHPTSARSNDLRTIVQHAAAFKKQVA